jgi:hypothetical protein
VFWVLGALAAITAVWGPKSWLKVSVLLSFSAGFLMGFLGERGGFSLGLFLGAIMAFVVGIGGASTRYFKEGGMQKILKAFIRFIRLKDRKKMRNID